MTETLVLILLGTAILFLLLLILLRIRSLEKKITAGEDERQATLLARTGEMLESKQRALSEGLRDAIFKGHRDMGELVRGSLKDTTDTLNQRFAELTRMADGRLKEISGRVDEQLSQGFEKTQKIFSDVLSRLAVIDKAQERIAKLSENVVSLQDVLTDKRARGAFGEIQLHQLISQTLPPSAYTMQATLSNGRRVDCLIKLPDPIGHLAVDSKFSLENYQRSVNPDLPEQERRQAAVQFRQDITKHIDDIANRYIIPGETTDGAVMFLPSEAVFAELHAHHEKIIAYAHKRRVWLASPTTMMAILTSVAAALKDVETRKQVHIIQEHLRELAKDFSRFGQRFDRLATHIRQAHKDTEEIHISARKISGRFSKIERVQLEEGQTKTGNKDAISE
jgi:DNA recombination protein RmuC